MNVTHTHMQPRARLVLASVVVLTTLLLIGARPSIASAASNVHLHPNYWGGGGCSYNTIVAIATSTNISIGSLYIDNNIANNNQSAILLITPTLSPNGGGAVANNHPTGVWYDTYKGRWAIFNEDETTIPVGAAFNVFIGTSGCQAATVTTNSANTTGDSVILPKPTIQTQQDLYIVTHNWDPNGGSGLDNNHPIGVWFEGPQGPWAIFNQDMKPMSLEVSFNFSTGPFCAATSCGPVKTVTTSTSYYDYNPYISDPRSDGDPSAKILLTPNWNPNGGVGNYNNHNFALLYNTVRAKWEIVSVDGSGLFNAETFNYAIIGL
jgi:hypothetical protein